MLSPIELTRVEALLRHFDAGTPTASDKRELREILAGQDERVLDLEMKEVEDFARFIIGFHGFVAKVKATA